MSPVSDFRGDNRVMTPVVKAFFIQYSHQLQLCVTLAG
jgi:hypothetical protein